MVKKLIILFCLLTTPTWAIEIVAFANEKAITDYDINVRRSLLKVVSPRKIEGKSLIEQEKSALIDLINDTAKITLASKNRAMASDQDVQETYKNMMKGRTKLPHFNYDIEYYKEYLKTQIAWMRVIQMRIAPNTSLSDTEIKDYYEVLKKTPLIPSTLHLSQIIVEESDRVNSVFSEVKNIRSCKAFNEKSQLYGAPGSGDMGRITSKSLAPPLQNIFANAPIKKVLEPMPIGQGAIIFMVCSRVQKNLLKDDDIKEKIKFSLLNQKVEVLADQYLHDYRDQMYIEIKNPKYKDVKDLLF
ncbi:MAG: hypothetical protein JW812_01420 [Alphaproteobacteria bacterium]|nr:hypothetical protein [Alphaproteobacteria bacterium]MBN2779495.1 hypothetical protein [Alphaproteobacteria bacterium]